MTDATSAPLWAHEELELRRIVKNWVTRSIRDQRHVPYRGGKAGHDEGTFTTAWCGYYALSGDSRVLDYMRHLRDEYLAYSEAHQVHSYDDWGEVHHQTEHTTIFLTRLWHLDVSDAVTARAIEDAAHHAGNWVPGIPDWYDWENHRFKSWSMGTRLVQGYPPFDFNVPDHFKVIQMALSAYLAVGKQRYLDLCCDYSDMWVDRILTADEERPPVVLFNREMSRAEREQRYGEFETPVIRMYAHLHDEAPRARRVELHVAAASLEVFLDLYRLTGKEAYVDAVRVMLPPIIEALSDPDAEIPALFLSKYRWATGDTCYDGELLRRIAPAMEQDLDRMVMLIGAHHEREPIVGRIGRRIDQVRWGYQRDDGMVVPEAGSAPGTLMLGYEINGDLSLATRALAVARRRLELATFTLRDGREHGCAAHAVAAGHGRATGAGCVTTTLYPFAMGAHRYAGGERLALRFARQDGSLGLPEGVASRWLPTEGDRVRVELCNTLDEAVHVTVKPGVDGVQVACALQDGLTRPVLDAECAVIAVPPGGLTDVVLRYQ
jgi:hypothetical protein